VLPYLVGYFYCDSQQNSMLIWTRYNYCFKAKHTKEDYKARLVARKSLNSPSLGALLQRPSYFRNDYDSLSENLCIHTVILRYKQASSIQRFGKFMVHNLDEL